MMCDDHDDGETKAGLFWFLPLPRHTHKTKQTRIRVLCMAFLLVYSYISRGIRETKASCPS
jgi:hypothetical protein